MSLSFSETSELYKLKALAEEKGRDDLIPEIDALLASDDNQVDLMSREGRVYEKEFKAEQLEYRENKDASLQLSELLRQAEEKGRDDLIPEIQELKSVVDKTVYDYEDITEEIRGAGSAALEAVSVGALGDEAQSCWRVAGGHVERATTCETTTYQFAGRLDRTPTTPYVTVTTTLTAATVSTSIPVMGGAVR